MTQKIAGYRKLSEHEIHTINVLKENGNALLDAYKIVAQMDGVDQRWLSIARTDLQTSVMAAVRAVAKPEGI
jgi:hypothetical protein